jgi:hypothetical protein
MNQEITFTISDFLERLLSLTNEDLIRHGSRLIWMDHIQRLKKQEGVYWLVSLNKEFVFDLATRGGVLYLIRNYKSTDHNMVFIDLNKLPDVPCMVQVAWDCDFIELVVSIQKNTSSKDLIDHKSNKKTIGTNTPTELVTWVYQQNTIQQTKYASKEDFRKKLISILKSLQRKIDTYSTLDEFWEKALDTKNKILYTPKTESEIFPYLKKYISDELALSQIQTSIINKTKAGAQRVIFSSSVDGSVNCKIVLEMINAHSDLLLDELSNNFPAFMRAEKLKYGILIVLWYKSERFEHQKYDTIETMEFDLHSTLNKIYYGNQDIRNNITLFTLDLTPDTKHSDRHHMANNSLLQFTNLEHELFATYKNRKIIFGNIIMIGKKNASLTDYQHIRLAKDNLKSYCSTKKIPYKSGKKIIPIYSKSIVNNYTPFYKYVQTEVFDEFILKGKWQLGTIEQYRTIENIKQRDVFEGFSFLNLNINHHFIGITFISGFNYLILCGTRSANSDYHKTNFGEKILHFKNVRSFADSIMQTIKAKQYFIQDIEYNSTKYCIAKDKIHDERIDLRNLFTPPFFDKIFENITYPSIFVKPEEFQQENEVRIVFEMEKDYFDPYQFENKNLLNMISS